MKRSEKSKPLCRQAQRFLRLSKNLQKSLDNRAAGELEGVKTRLEYNNPSSEKAWYNRLFREIAF